LICWWGDFFSGAKGARINSTGSLEQTLTGLAPNTTYVLSAWVKVDGETLDLGVRNFGGDEQTVSVKKGDWVQRTLEFKTGASNTTATIFIRKTNGWSAAYADLVTVVRK
jgi:hypothetical protein